MSSLPVQMKETEAHAAKILATILDPLQSLRILDLSPPDSGLQNLRSPARAGQCSTEIMLITKSHQGKIFTGLHPPSHLRSIRATLSIAV